MGDEVSDEEKIKQWLNEAQELCLEEGHSMAQSFRNLINKKDSEIKRLREALVSVLDMLSWMNDRSPAKAQDLSSVISCFNLVKEALKPSEES